MAWLPIARTPIQYEKTDGNPANGYYLKFYLAGTTTPTAMATDTTGATQLAKCKLNERGFPISNASDETSIFIPHVNSAFSAFKYVIYQSAADADANNFANAIVNISSVGSVVDVPSYLSTYVATVDTYADISAELNGMSIGQQFILSGHTIAGIGGGIFDVVSSSGLTADGGTIVINGAMAAKRKYEYLMPEFFGAIGDGATNDIAALDAFNAALSMSVDGVMDGDYKINRTFKIRRGKKIRGCGSIIADFTTTASWSADYCAIDLIVDSADSLAVIFAGFGQYLKGIRVTSIAANTVQATGIRCRTSVSIAVSQVVNFSYLSGNIGATIEKFDTAIELRECWSTTFNDVIISNCRRAVYIHGKVVNVTFGSGCRFSNPDKSYTTSVADTIGVEIDSSTRYTAAAEGRPEGITICAGALIYGFDNNILATRFLALNVSDSIIDGAGKDCIVIGTGDDFSLDNNYIFSSGAYSGVYINGTSSAVASKFDITNNNFVGSSPTNTCYAINFANSGVPRSGVKIKENSFVDWTIGVNAILCPKNSSIEDNYGEGIGTDLIYIQNGGDGTTVDGNKTSSSVNALRLHPATSAELIIGKNKSALNRTSFIGKATVLAGTSTISLPNNFRTTGDNYVRALTKVTFITAFPGTFNITDEFSLSDAKLTLSTNALVDTIVRYECTAVPQSAF